MANRHFLVVRNAETGETRVTPYSRVARAFDALFATERKHVRNGVPDDRFSIVLIQAESEADLREAYPQYFRSGSRHERKDALAAEVRQMQHSALANS